MSATILDPQRLFAVARSHLAGTIEQVGFFLADFSNSDRAFVLRTWRPMPPEAFEFQSAYHVTLRCEVRPEIIKWAWDSGACLIEAHSHGDDSNACFSPSDEWGFKEWVPHVRWRLGRRPYAAIVTAGETFDALAWIDGTDRREQISEINTNGQTIAATTHTLSHGIALKDVYRGD